MKLTASLVLAAFAAGAAITYARQETQEASAPSPEMLARMAPGPMHAKLEPLIGKWTVTGKFRMTPDAAWEDFGGTMTRDWIMDGRFVREEVESEWMGQPFHGLGILGYDNVREEFTTVWIENMSTGTMTSAGTMGADGAITYEGVNSNCMTGEKKCWSKSRLVFKSPTEHVYTSYSKDDSGKEFQSGEIVATKVP